MANRWIASGSSAITAPTLGNVLALSTFRIVSRDLSWSAIASAGYWFSQAGSTSASREIGIYAEPSSDSITLILGGTGTPLTTTASAFGSTLIAGELDFELNLSTGAWTIKLDAILKASGTATVGSNRTAGVLFRLGARASTDTSGTASAYEMPAGNNIGDTDIYLDGALVRTYVMPLAGTNVPESTSAADGTLLNGDGSDWEAVAPARSITAPALSDPIYAIGTNGLCRVNLSGTYADIAPTLIEYRAMQGATTIQDWATVDSFGAGVYSFIPTVGVNEGITFEVRTTVDAVLYNDSTATIDIGIVMAVIGSSSSENWFTDSTKTTVGRVHTKKSGSWTTLDAAAMSGESAVELANLIYTKTGSPVGFYDNGLGGTKLTVEWDPSTGSSYSALVGAISNSNVSLFINQGGYNDAAASITVNTADVTALISSLRAIVGDVPWVDGASQRRIAAGFDAEFVALWQAFAEAQAALAGMYLFWRHDLTITGDHVHLTQADSNKSALRAAAICDYLYGAGTYYKGPSISSATHSGTEVTLTLNTTGTDYATILPSTAIAGFKVTDDGTESTLVDQSTASKTTIVLTLGSDIAGAGLGFFASYNQNVSGVSAFTNYPLVDSEISFPVDPVTSSFAVSVISVIRTKYRRFPWQSWNKLL